MRYFLHTHMFCLRVPYAIFLTSGNWSIRITTAMMIATCSLQIRKCDHSEEQSIVWKRCTPKNRYTDQCHRTNLKFWLNTLFVHESFFSTKLDTITILERMRRRWRAIKRQRKRIYNATKRKTSRFISDWRCVENILLKYVCTMVRTFSHAIVNGNDTIIIVTFLFYLMRGQIRKRARETGRERGRGYPIRAIVVDAVWLEKVVLVFFRFFHSRFESFIEKCEDEWIICKYLAQHRTECYRARQFSSVCTIVSSTCINCAYNFISFHSILFHFIYTSRSDTDTKHPTIM